QRLVEEERRQEQDGEQVGGVEQEGHGNPFPGRAELSAKSAGPRRRRNSFSPLPEYGERGEVMVNSACPLRSQLEARSASHRGLAHVARLVLLAAAARARVVAAHLLAALADRLDLPLALAAVGPDLL